MKTYIISYCLRGISTNYMDLYEAIKTNYPEWRHMMEASWLVKTEDSAKSIVDKLKPHMDSRDSIFVSEITDDREGYIPKTTWEWLKSD